jgi:hypothetical protein
MTLVRVIARHVPSRSVDGPALKPWIEYLRRLPEPDRSIVLHDLLRYGVDLQQRGATG